MKTILLLAALIALLGCENDSYKILREADFKTELDGKSIELFTLKNSKGSTIQLTNFGARIVSIWMPDKNGKFDDVNTGFATGGAYLEANGPYYGNTVGRYANRIAKGQFILDSVQYQLPINNGVNSIHGGSEGLFKKVWDVAKVSTTEVVFSYLSVDGEQGYPGNLQLYVSFSLSDDNELIIAYKASTDKATPINLSNHAFFNLGGEASGTILDHHLYINADYYTPLDSTQIPTGELDNVEGTPYNFKSSLPLGARINDDFEQLKLGNGYDINFVLNKDEELLSHAATLHDPTSGRVMDVYTTEPGIQLYTGNFMNGSDIGKFGKPLNKREGVCLETQHYADSPNQPQFPNTILQPGENFNSKTIYRFSVAKH
ncbi:aldose epimerase family protein [Saccharicrinis aurantiacus]|uniref:aldose epimerase family protein n=1 Tax=Saccharicrinis aurantiacus TaxID=1849719 RepID=UPI00249176F4|nr:aldose epimerase family protein [Saccharicrinis aurantiacus]